MNRLVVAAILILGCGPSGPKVYHIKGYVTYKGKPVKAGVITFEPDTAKSNDGPQGFAVIKDGQYDTSSPDCKGVVGGPYIIRITGYDGVTQPELPLGKSLFPPVEERREFTGGAVEHNFEVK